MKKQSNNSESYKGLGTWDLGLGNTGIPDTGKSAIKQSGFSLMELMMSLGILVVGLAMIATAFPSAMLETKLSVADTSATMISENATAICRVRLSHSAIKLSVTATLSDQTTLINPAHTGDLTYPVNTPDSRYGWLLAAAQPNNNINDYQLVIVPYRKFLPTDRPGIEFGFVPVTVTDSGTKAAGADIGSPVILTTGASVGAFAFVVDADGTLSPTLADGAALAVNYSGGDNSPAIGCYVVRTAVRP